MSLICNLGEKDDSNGQTGAMLNMLAEVASQTLRQTETATPAVRRKVRLRPTPYDIYLFEFVSLSAYEITFGIRKPSN